MKGLHMRKVGQIFDDLTDEQKKKRLKFAKDEIEKLDADLTYLRRRSFSDEAIFELGLARGSRKVANLKLKSIFGPFIAW